MKKISILLAFLACSTILVTFGSANCAVAFSQWDQFFFPSEPNYTPPSIAIYTPIQNENHNVTDASAILNVDLNFTITKDSPGQLLSVWYTLDDNEKVFMETKDSDNPYNSNFALKYTARLHVGCGVHSLNVGAEQKSYYIGYNEREKWVLNSVNVSAVSEPVTITILPPPTPTPTQTPLSQTENQHALNPIDYLLPISALVVVIVVLVLLYGRHKKRLTQNNRALPS